VNRAIISDIHGNLDALDAVLADIQQQGIDEIYCLGDVVGYGPNPCECLDKAMEFRACLLGNHDMAALCEPDGFNDSARKAIQWTRLQLRPETASDNGSSGSAGASQEATEAANRRHHFLCNLPRTIRENKLLFVHGSARNPLSEYVFPNDASDEHMMSRIFELIPAYCFQGHTHVPGIFTQTGRFFRPQELGNGFQLSEEKVMVNVGSVGQPRDGDPRSCYVVLRDGVVRYRRVAYPVERTVSKIHAITCLDRFLGDRLLQGQ